MDGRRFTKSQFNCVYDEAVLSKEFFENPGYYRLSRSRYRNTLKALTSLPIPLPARIMEIGGGQIALLCHRLFHDQVVVADQDEKYAKQFETEGLGFWHCDLLYDEFKGSADFDLVVLCEVIEHIPRPPHLIFEVIRKRIRPGGYLFLTTPNLYRIRNVIRLAAGKRVFDTFVYPERGRSIGHFLEYSKDQLHWHLARAGFDQVQIDFKQLSFAGFSRLAQLGRIAAAPLNLVPRWRNSLVVSARAPEV